jgi:hypothetical protein
MRRTLILAALICATCMLPQSFAQKHTSGASPPTAPPPKLPVPVLPASSGMGAMQFFQVSYGVPAPQSLTRQLEAEDERTRSASLAAIGAPQQYLQRGRVAFPRSIELDFVPLGDNDDLDAILTVELEQHMVSAILMPESGNWKRVGTLVFPTPFFDPTTTPATFLRTARSFIQPSRYRAIYHSYMPGPNTDYVENEAHVHIMNGKAVVTISFVSSQRTCEPAPSGRNARPYCDITQRWLQADPSDATRRFILVTATGRMNDKDIASPLNKARTYQSGHLRTYVCQPYIFNEVTERYEPTANPLPCPTPPK